MPPKLPPRGTSARGGPASSRGGHSPAPPRSGGSSQVVQIPAHIQALGVKRPDYGSGGMPLEVSVNAYHVEFDEGTVYHYDDITPTSASARFNMSLIRHLQTSVAPQVFSPPAVYDGKKNLFSSHRLPLGDTDTQTFTFLPPDAPPESATVKTKKAPRQIKVKLTKVNKINTAALKEYLNQRQSSDEFVLTALIALNVATRMRPAERYTFTSRSFFTAQGKQSIGRGIELWRGVFQSLRPTLYRLIMNVDTATGVMYKPGPLIDLCLEYLGASGSNLSSLFPQRGLNDSDRRALQSFITDLRVVVTLPSTPPRVLKTGTIKGISRTAANNTRFEVDGRQITIEQYFQEKYNIRLRSPQAFCVQIGTRDALYPVEMCRVIEGQSVPRHKLPMDKTKDIVEFSSVPPIQRFQRIQSGVDEVLAFGQSDYIRQFGMTIDTTRGFIRIKARVLNPTKVQYGKDSKPQAFDAKDGSWNLMGKRFYKPETITILAIVIYDPRFKNQVNDMIKGIREGCASLGMKISDNKPFVKWENGQGNIIQQFKNLGPEIKASNGQIPNLVFVVLPEGGDDIYRQIKHFGDVMVGIATQCVKSLKASKAKPQYWANVLAKVNVKLGGINHILDPRSVSILKDDKNPLIVMGADVMHPGSSNRPSYTALVGSVDSVASKYVSSIRAQTSRNELIEDLEEMCNDILNSHSGYKKSIEKANWPPKRLIFFRDGVSEGQFSQVLSEELPMVRRSCEKFGIKPKITLLVVGKRHHFRFMNPGNTSTGHTPSGTTVDTDVTNPIDFEWYTQSHKPLLGTSRPAHYTVLYDDNGFDSNTLQSFAHAMCHVYARSTGAVSIPAPVYYADTICARAPIHYAPGADPASLSETMTNRSDAEMLEEYKKNFKPINPIQARRMYFM